MKKYNNLSAIRQELENGSLNLPALVQYYLGRIEATRNLNIYLEVYGEEALQRAQVLQQEWQQGQRRRLTGLVLSLKDNICYKGHGVSASSKILEGFESVYSATVVERLLEEGAIIIGRTNCDEFAMGASNENSAYGPVLNALDPERVPGGSSGGAAVSVQADTCLAALGSDTGGSIRQPAAFTGLFGFKPTYGLVSRWGLLAYASSFDQIGPITSTLEDTALLMEIMSGPDEYDATCVQQPVPPYTEQLELNGKKRIAYIKDCLDNEGLDPEIRQKTQQLIEQLKADGHTVEAVSFPYLDYMVPNYYVLTTAEASSNFSRYAGVVYGYRSDAATDLESTYKKSRSEGFGTEVKRRIMLGTFVLSSDYQDAYYTKSLKVRRIIHDKTAEILKDFDFILSPTTTTTAFKLGEKNANPIAMYLADLFTVQANLAGVPALSIPAGLHSNGMPFGMQLMANKFDEAGLFSMAVYLQTAMA